MPEHASAPHPNSKGNPAPLGTRLDLLRRLAVADGNGARLQPLGHIAHEVDVEQAVLDVGALDFDMVGEAEASIEGSGGNATVQELALRLLGLLLAAHAKRLLVDVNLQLVLAEAGHRHGDAVLVVAEPLDVVG